MVGEIFGTSELCVARDQLGKIAVGRLGLRVINLDYCSVSVPPFKLSKSGKAERGNEEGRLARSLQKRQGEMNC
jgi:hypothetical protein